MKLKSVLLFLLITSACEQKPARIKPTVSDISESVYASGFVKSKNQYEVFSSVNGIITEILVKEGDKVKKGSPLLRIFNKPADLNARNAQLAAESAKLSANKNKLAELRMSIDVAKARMESDSIVWQRQRNLWSQNIGTKTEFEQKELNYKNSRNSYNTALINFHEVVRQLELNASQAKNTFEINSILAGEYTVKSEVEGKIYKIFKEKGEMVNALNPVALVGDQHSFILELQVDERDIYRIKANQKAYVTMDSHKGQTFEAVITSIDPVMNIRTKSFNVEADFVAPPSTLYPFLTVEANILIQTKPGVLLIPRSYLVEDSFVITADKKKRRIVTGLQDYQNVEVVDGLEANDYILKPEL